MTATASRAEIKRVLVIFPTYNEIETIEKITTAVLQKLPEHHVLVVDDNSPDGTGKRVEELASQQERLHIMHRAKKEGLGPAYLAGFQWAFDQGYDVIFTMDADFSHPVEKLNDMLAALESADWVIGSRYVKGGGIEGWGLHRLILSRTANLYASLVSGMGVKDCTAGFNAIRCDVLKRIGLSRIITKGYGFLHELKYRAFRLGFKLSEIPIIFVDRTEGVSKMSGNIIGEAFFRVLALRFSKIVGDTEDSNSMASEEVQTESEILS